MVCDLRSPDGYAAARALALEADVIIENFRPGVMERLGFDYAELSQGNPGLIWCSITGFGREEGAALAGYDLLVQALGGLMSITGAPDTGPMKVGVALVDILTGQNALSGNPGGAPCAHAKRSRSAGRREPSVQFAVRPRPTKPRAPWPPASPPDGWAMSIRASRRTVCTGRRTANS